MRRNVAIYLCIVVLLLISGTLRAEDLYVQSAKAKIMWEPTFKSKVMAEVGSGHKFVSIGKEGNWVKVKFDYEVGYVSSLLLANHPPFAKQGLIKAADSDLRVGVRRRASTYTSAAAARGLAQEGRKRLSKEEKADYYSLEKIEAYTVSSDEISRFIEGGKI